MFDKSLIQAENIIPTNSTLYYTHILYLLIVYYHNLKIG